MRLLLGCLSVVFIVFGGCVLAIFSEGVAPDEWAFAISAVVIFFSGIWMLYKAVTIKPTPPAGGRRKTRGDDSDHH
jgi:hypothetical protein